MVLQLLLLQQEDEENPLPDMPGHEVCVLCRQTCLYYWSVASIIVLYTAVQQ